MILIKVIRVRIETKKAEKIRIFLRNSSFINLVMERFTEATSKEEAGAASSHHILANCSDPTGCPKKIGTTGGRWDLRMSIKTAEATLIPNDK